LVRIETSRDPGTVKFSTGSTLVHYFLAHSWAKYRKVTPLKIKRKSS